MKVMAIALILFFVGPDLFAQSLITLRIAFTSAATTNKEAFTQFQQKVFQNTNAMTPILKGYQAACHFLHCRYLINPYEKWQYFLKGKSQLEEAISIEPMNIELHWLRYAIQTQLPFFLNYHQHEKEDQKILINFIKSANPTDKDLLQRTLQLIQQTSH